MNWIPSSCASLKVFLLLMSNISTGSGKSHGLSNGAWWASSPPASLGRDFTNRLSNLTFGFIQDLQATSLNASVITFDRWVFCFCYIGKTERPKRDLWGHTFRKLSMCPAPFVPLFAHPTDCQLIISLLLGAYLDEAALFLSARRHRKERVWRLCICIFSNPRFVVRGYLLYFQVHHSDWDAPDLENSRLLDQIVHFNFRLLSGVFRCVLLFIPLWDIC